MKFDVITIGSAGVDTFLHLNMHEKNHSISIPAGTKVLVEKLSRGTGGGGTNSAVSFSRLGLKTGFIGKLGDDENGNFVLSELKKEKVEFLGASGREPTGTSFILDAKERNRSILFYRGANSFLSEKDFSFSDLKTSWIYFGSMTEKSLETEIKIAKFAVEKGIRTALNPSSYAILENRKGVLEIAKRAEILILNEKESGDLIGEKNNFKKLHSLGPKIVCITYGDEGNKVSDGENIYSVRAHKIKVVERTGAGDAFGSGFVAGIIKFGDIEKAIKLGTANAESVVGHGGGAKNGLLKWSEAIKKMNGVKVF